VDESGIIVRWGHTIDQKRSQLHRRFVRYYPGRVAITVLTENLFHALIIKYNVISETLNKH
jgi:hypothetical protein